MSVGNRPWLCYIAGGYYIIVLYNLRSLGVDNCKSILIIIYTIHDTKMIIKYFSLELSIFILFISLCVIRFQHYSRPFFLWRSVKAGGEWWPTAVHHHSNGRLWCRLCRGWLQDAKASGHRAIFTKGGDVFIEANSKEIQEKDIITRKKSFFSPPIVENILT